MRIAVFDTKGYDRDFLERANASHAHDLTFLEPRLTHDTAALASGHDAVCAFVSDQLDGQVLEELAAQGVGLVALRCAGFNNVDLTAAARHDITIVRVPDYSPHAVAEHSVALMLSLSRPIHRAYNRVREGNFSLEGLLGFELAGTTVGVVGAGRIGSVAARILMGFGCRILVADPIRSAELVQAGVEYVPIDELAQRSKVLSLHCPLNNDTYHLVGREFLAKTPEDVMIINTSRGAVLDTKAIIDGLKSGHIGSLGLDVYEEESELFFSDRSDEPIQDDQFVRLMTFPNVLITGHQGFFTHEALTRIAATTIANLDAFAAGTPQNVVSSNNSS